MNLRDAVTLPIFLVLTAESACSDDPLAAEGVLAVAPVASPATAPASGATTAAKSGLVTFEGCGDPGLQAAANAIADGIRTGDVKALAPYVGTGPDGEGITAQALLDFWRPVGSPWVVRGLASDGFACTKTSFEFDDRHGLPVNDGCKGRLSGGRWQLYSCASEDMD